MNLAIKKALENAAVAVKEGRLAEAEKLYRDILQVNPSHADANHKLGTLALAMAKPEVSWPFFKQALVANPKSEQYWLDYIDALVKSNQFSAAKKIINQAKLRGIKSNKLEHFEKMPRMGTTVDQVESKRPSDQELQAVLEHYNSRRLNQAEKLSRKLTKLYPQHPFAWKVLGAVLLQIGHKSDALHAFQKSVEASPNDAQAHSNCGAALQALGQFEKAARSYRNATSLDPDYADAHINLGATLQELGELDEAVISCQKAIALKPNSVEAHANLGAALKELKRFDEAETVLRKAIDLNPNSKESHGSLGAVLFMMGRHKEGLDHKLVSDGAIYFGTGTGWIIS